MQRQIEKVKKTGGERRSTLETFRTRERPPSATAEEESGEAIWKIDEFVEKVWLLGEEVAEENRGKSRKEWIQWQSAVLILIMKK